MKAIQVVARGKAEFVEIPKPEVKPGHVVVRTAYLSLCGSDIQMLHYAPEENYPYPPGTTGHEMVGYVESVGDGDSPFQVGDRVLALAPGHLAMLEWFQAPYKNVILLPDGMSFEVLLQAQQLGTVLYAAQRLPNLIGKNVAVIGQGSAGLWFNFQLRRLGAHRVIALDLDDIRLERSAQYGATHYFNNQKTEPIQQIHKILDGKLADLVIEAAGEIDSINLAIDLVRPYGDILYFGVPRAQWINLNYQQYFWKCLRATAVVGAQLEPNQLSTRIAVDLIADGTADAASLITHRLPFNEVINAYEMHRTRSDGAVKIIIEMPGAQS